MCCVYGGGVGEGSEKSKDKILLLWIGSQIRRLGLNKNMYQLCGGHNDTAGRAVAVFKVALDLMAAWGRAMKLKRLHLHDPKKSNLWPFGHQTSIAPPPA